MNLIYTLLKRNEIVYIYNNFCYLLFIINLLLINDKKQTVERKRIV